MNERTDSELLRDYAEGRSEAAFAELVRRHVDLVHSAALRMVRDTHLAEDVTQGVFAALARDARLLLGRPVLSGWLHRTARNLAANVVRAEVRRRAREQEAATMNELLADPAEPAWEQIAPLLDDALGDLTDTDRDAVLLRYFERKSARDLARLLGVSDEAAQKRVTRAVDRLRDAIEQRGVKLGAGGLAVVISAHAVQAAPAGLAVTISTTTTLAGATLATTAAATTTKAIAMTTLQKSLVVATVAVLAGIGIHETRQAARLRQEVKSLQQAQAGSEARVTFDDEPTEQDRLDAMGKRIVELSNQLVLATAEKSRMEAEKALAQRSLAVFKELADQSPARDQNSTNAYPTARHAMAGMGRISLLAIRSNDDDSTLTPAERAAKQEARLNAFLEVGNIMKAMERAEQDALEAGSGYDDDPADMITCLLHGALKLDERQFGAVYSLVQGYPRQPKQSPSGSESSNSEMAAQFEYLLKTGQSDLMAILTPEQRATFEKLVPVFDVRPDKFTINFDFTGK